MISIEWPSNYLKVHMGLSKCEKIRPPGQSLRVERSWKLLTLQQLQGHVWLQLPLKHDDQFDGFERGRTVGCLIENRNGSGTFS